jgi:hypothetical protein
MQPSGSNARQACVASSMLQVLCFNSVVAVMLDGTAVVFVLKACFRCQADHCFWYVSPSVGLQIMALQFAAEHLFHDVQRHASTATDSTCVKAKRTRDLLLFDTLNGNELLFNHE